MLQVVALLMTVTVTTLEVSFTNIFIIQATDGSMGLGYVFNFYVWKIQKNAKSLKRKINPWNFKRL
jgi:hypothetical protein